MLEIISWMIIGMLTYITDCYVFSKVTKSKMEYTIKNLVLLLLTAVVYGCFKRNASTVLCFIIVNLETIFLLKMIFQQSIGKTLIAALFIFVGFSISEVLFVICLKMILNVDVAFLNQIEGIWIGNIAIILIFLLINSPKKVRETVGKIMDWYKDNDKINTITFIILIVISFAVITYPITKQTKTYDETFGYIVFFVCSAVFIIGFFKQKTKNNHLELEYEQILKYARVYEEELDEKSKKQHEYRNQLVIIKNMVKTKKVKKYIDELLEEDSIETDRSILNQLKYLPDGGLKGLIYFKVAHLQYKDAEVHINVSSSLKNKTSWKACSENLRDVSKVIGVFLDNAIEALQEEQEKYLILDIDYDKEGLLFSFSNTCTKHIDFERIDHNGYTTKGRNHGYGLSLVQDIVSKNKFLGTTKEINGKFFVQHLYVYKKSR